MIRTCDPCVPNAVLYRAELHSDISCAKQNPLVIPVCCKDCQFYQSVPIFSKLQL